MMKPDAKATIQGFSSLTAMNWCLLTGGILSGHAASAAMRLNDELIRETYLATPRPQVEEKMLRLMTNLSYTGADSEASKAFLKTLLDSVYEPVTPE